MSNPPTENKNFVPSLMQMCQEKIVHDIMNLPPLLQERVVGYTKNKMLEEAKICARKEIYERTIDVHKILKHKCSKLVYRNNPEMITELPENIEKEEETMSNVFFDSIVGYINPIHHSLYREEEYEEDEYDESDSDHYF